MDNQLSPDEEYAVSVVSQYYALTQTEDQLPEIVGTCEHCGLNIIQYSSGEKKIAQCLSDAGFKELLNRIILHRKNKQQ